MKLRIKKNYRLFKTTEYQEWLDEQPDKAKVQIAERLSNIELEGYFGDHKSLDKNIWELKWINGRRIYYGYIAKLDILFLLGGNKNGQSKDINKAKKIFKKYSEK